MTPENISAWTVFQHPLGFEIKITAEATEYIENVLQEPYLRLGAEKGGCSGWLYIVNPEKIYQEEKDLQIVISPKLKIVVDKQQALDVLKTIKIYLKNLSFGMQLKIEKEGTGVHCGCGDSFQ